MERRWLKVLVAVAIAASAAACSDRSAPVAPSSAPPSTTSPRLTTLDGYYYIGSFRMINGRGVATQTKLAIMDEHGGKLTIGGSSITFPEQALSGSTLISFTLQSAPYISARVYALSLEGKTRGTLVTTFPVALSLVVSYADANQLVANPSQMKVAWLENGVLIGLVPSQVDVQSKKVTAQITHFTEFNPILTDLAPNFPN